MPVHLFGLCADMDEIKNVSGKIPLVEDGACAAGAEYKGTPAGALGSVGCFSFHPRKSVTTGEGGMLTTNNDEIASLIDKMRNHGASVSEEQRHKGPQPYVLPDFNVVGYNYRMTDLQGAVGSVQIKKLDTFIDERNKWATFYNTQFSDIDWLAKPIVQGGYRHGWQSYVLLVDEAKAPRKRNEIMQALSEEGISTRPGTHAVHMLGVYREKFGIKPQDFPNSMAANNFSMSIPLHNRMIEEDYDYVASAIKSIK
jgi:dTDP-4-amino-4,6-dideoxygalactose transaminase